LSGGFGSFTLILIMGLHNMDMPKFVKPRKVPNQVYLRFGRWSVRSINFATGQQEPGVSVYPAHLIDGMVFLKDVDAPIPWRRLEGRLAFVVTGDECGYGSDGEPCLRRVKALSYPIALDTVSAGFRRSSK